MERTGAVNKKAMKKININFSITSSFHDTETRMHVMRMAHYSVATAKKVGLSDDDCRKLTITAPMHDIGKIGISDYILLKPGKLTDDEFERIKKHTEIGAKILKGRSEIKKVAREIALTHHENWNGTGYPRGLSGEEIPIFGRICSIADVFDALVSERTYKQEWTINDAIDWINNESGKNFDPQIVAAFTDALPQILKIKELYRDEIIVPDHISRIPIKNIVVEDEKLNEL